MPAEYLRHLLQALSALAFLSNFAFKSDSGYFAMAAQTKPLLHTWSLSLEWQFYFCMPLVAALVWRLDFARNVGDQRSRHCVAGLRCAVPGVVPVGEPARCCGIFLLFAASQGLGAVSRRIGCGLGDPAAVGRNRTAAVAGNKARGRCGLGAGRRLHRLSSP
jgi:peptidoglycan/LPS O-acetylase OafA/YrhL